MTLNISSITAKDASLLHQFLARQPLEYRQHFHPFEDESIYALASILETNLKDRHRAVLFDGNYVAFYMLRGWQQGYARPSFGLLVDYQYAHHGLGKLCMQAALAECRLLGCTDIMLKVEPANHIALKLYLNAGFNHHSRCNVTGNYILVKQFR